MSKRVELHPASIKHIKKGHPWVTKDKYSLEFPKKDLFLWSKTGDLERVILINDPEHSQVKARVWSIIHQNDTFTVDSFKTELKERLEKAKKFRASLNLERENYYLCFAEADQLPGLYIVVLKDRVLLQLYSSFWNNFEKELVSFLRGSFKDDKIWIQKRNKEQEKVFQCLSKKVKEDSFEIEEFGIKYKIQLNQNYDIGIYTDMAAIRNRISGSFKEKNVLNLFSYTGAYSLFALADGATTVTSVDLSKKYIKVLEDNLSINNMAESHTSITEAVIPALQRLLKEGKSFDSIICDPPSSSTDGKKRTKAIDSYKDLLPLFNKLLTKKGEAFIFLNTHSITRNKFESKIKEYNKDNSFSITGHLKLTQDCPSLKGFPEGDYLKGLKLLKKKSL